MFQIIQIDFFLKKFYISNRSNGVWNFFLSTGKNEDDDSKALTEEKRDDLLLKLQDNSNYIGYAIHVLSPRYISSRTKLSKEISQLNGSSQITYFLYFHIIGTVLLQNTNSHISFPQVEVLINQYFYRCYLKLFKIRFQMSNSTFLNTF